MKKMENNFNLLNQKCFQNSIGLIHKVYLSQLKTSRKYTASTKTKSEVRGGGRKPWKQKGTGQARAGSNRSPLWVGGGVIFGPKPRVVIKKINKKEKTLAILFALYFKNCIILESKHINSLLKIKFSSNYSIIFNNFIQNYNNNTIFLNLFLKTKFISKVIALLKLETNFSQTLIISNNYKKDFWLATRNIKTVSVVSPSMVNLRQILNAKNIIIIH